MSSSSNRDDREINDCHEESNSSEGSSSSKSSSLDTVYQSGTPGILLEVFQEKMRKRAASGSFVGQFITPTTPIPCLVQPTDNVLACCAFNTPSSIDMEKLHKLRDKYQFPDDIHTCLPATGEWCYTPNSPRLGIYRLYVRWSYASFKCLCQRNFDQVRHCPQRT